MFSGIVRSCYGSNLLRNIIEHPFNVALMNNTLSTESFKFYIQQGILFLESYIRTVLIVASKIEDHNIITLLYMMQVVEGSLLSVLISLIFFYPSRIVIPMKL